MPSRRPRLDLSRGNVAIPQEVQRLSGNGSGNEDARTVEAAVERALAGLDLETRVRLLTGINVEVVVPVDPHALRHWDVETGDWAVEPGRSNVRVGRSIGDLPLAALIEVQG